MRRDLPWRHTRDPWAVLVSELMLQQTQANRVVPRWSAFLERFPTPATCAAASVGDVIVLWAGLGYNRRAVSLHRAAVVVVNRYDGRVPDRLEDLLALPGVGPYTARAVLAFAFERDIGVVETNSARVLARLAGRRLTVAEAQARADGLVAPGAGWSWNQTVLDLGATVCTARQPSCGCCPVARFCAWHVGGQSSPDPASRRPGSSDGSGRSPAFVGSDRQARGRLLDALRRGPASLEPKALASACGCPGNVARAQRIADGLVADGLAAVEPGSAGTITRAGSTGEGNRLMLAR